ncbi:amidohydrolase family protein [Streptomyces sp. Ag109_O5-1]|uniref:amidohydrolase family protein n=1 Tax=Streptomyces sp. Ag109_O5-1 TaxID=1938851 RepID=UPI0021A5463C|nr:amidohydrolase family protein [Streptomyces sp. Ag109_O5-1]
MLADTGSSVAISPDVELKTGFGWPMTGRVLAAGLRPTLSVDDVPSAGGDMFSTLRTAFAVQRGLDGGLRSRDLLEFATVAPARSCGLDARTGSLTPGKDAGAHPGTATMWCRSVAPVWSPCGRPGTRCPSPPRR